MKHLEANKESIIKEYKLGVPVKKLCEKYHCANNTMVKHLKLWGVKK